MTATVTKLHTDSIKEASIPDFLQRMETADTTIVIHLTGGKWDMQHLKGKTDIRAMIGILHIIITHLSNVANGLVKLK